MELNEGYRWLSRPRAVDSKIRRLESKIEELRTCLEPNAIRYDVEKVNSSPDDMTSKIFAEIDETERLIMEKSLERACMVSEIAEAIELIDNELQKTILTEFFISKRPTREISKELNYDLSWVNKQRKEGVRKIASLRGN
jgi:hypothetical protein